MKGISIKKMVARDRIELPTRGFSVEGTACTSGSNLKNLITFFSRSPSTILATEAIPKLPDKFFKYNTAKSDLNH